MSTPLIPDLGSKAPKDAPKDAAAPVPESTPHPQATAPASFESGPSSADLDAVAAEEAAKHATSAPASLPNPTSHVDGLKGGPQNPSLDSNKLDSLGNEKENVEAIGPRGKGQPLDVMTDEDRAAVAQKQEDRLKKGMSSTDNIDSVGKPQGTFKVIPQGLDKHGARIPDKVTSVLVEEQPPQLGPRGNGAPQDCFHGERPAKKP